MNIKGKQSNKSLIDDIKPIIARLEKKHADRKSKLEEAAKEGAYHGMNSAEIDKAIAEDDAIHLKQLEEDTEFLNKFFHLMHFGRGDMAKKHYKKYKGSTSESDLSILRERIKKTYIPAPISVKEVSGFEDQKHVTYRVGDPIYLNDLPSHLQVKDSIVTEILVKDPREAQLITQNGVSRPVKGGIKFKYKYIKKQNHE